MDKLTICSVKINDTIFKTNALIDDAGNRHGYRVMRNRNIAVGGNLFLDERSAIMHMLRLAFSDVAQTNMFQEL